MNRREESSTIAKLVRIALALGALLISVYAVQSLMHGRRMVPIAVLGLFTIISVFLVLDKYYWLLCPFFLLLGISIPGIRLDPGELGCASVIGMYLVRKALGKEPSFHLSPNILPLVPLVCWIGFVYLLKPAGLAMFGAQTIGLRFYLKFLLAFLAAIVFSSIALDESDCRILYKVCFSAACLRLVLSILVERFQPEDIFSGDFEYGTRYYLESGIVIYALILARYSLSGILASPAMTLLAACLATLTLYSGRRTNAGLIFLYPLFHAILSRTNRLATMVVSSIGVILLIFLVAGDGTVYKLPYSVQRPLAIIAPQYRSMGFEGAGDTFRREMRSIAYEIIRDSPWFGRGGFTLSREETIWLTSLERNHSFRAMAYSGNWHNIWLSYAADLGIPAMLMWGVFVLCVTVFCFKNVQVLPLLPYQRYCFLFFSMQLLGLFAFSWVSTAAPSSSIHIWVRFGFLLAIANGARRSVPAFPTESKTEANE